MEGNKQSEESWWVNGRQHTLKSNYLKSHRKHDWELFSLFRGTRWPLNTETWYIWIHNHNFWWYNQIIYYRSGEKAYRKWDMWAKSEFGVWKTRVKKDTMIDILIWVTGWGWMGHEGEAQSMFLLLPLITRQKSNDEECFYYCTTQLPTLDLL